jgi:hypothetical protein
MSRKLPSAILAAVANRLEDILIRDSSPTAAASRSPKRVMLAPSSETSHTITRRLSWAVRTAVTRRVPVSASAAIS